MFDIGWTEMAVIALLLLLVIGPRELPTMMRTVGRYVRKARMLTRDFQHSLDEMAREAELDEAKKTIQSAKSMNLERSFEETLDPDGEVKAEARALDSEARNASKSSTSASSTVSAASEDPVASAAASSETASGQPTGGNGATTQSTANTAPEEARAEHRVQPASPAPAHSVRPPAEEPAASKTRAG